MNTRKTDVAIIGGGIVGLATAYRILDRSPSTRMVVLEKEDQVAKHQTGHNSGVLHSGIYYKPGSMKAINCREGKLAMEDFCRREEISHEICGKVIVAIDESELPAMQRIFERGQQNQVQCEIIDQDRLKKLEPHAVGVAAIHVPEAGIVDYREVCERMAQRIAEKEGELLLGERVKNIEKSESSVVVTSPSHTIEARHVINCTGLFCDRVTKMAGQEPQSRIVPFRGEYFELKPDVHHLCRNLIYPVPDPSFPFLGVHFTRMIQGGVECGPNAVFAFSREGYRKTDINLRDLVGSLTYPGFIKMAMKYWKTGMGEMWRSFSKTAFVKALQRLLPEIRAEHLTAAPAGVRAQALSPSGQLVDDFLIAESKRVINVCNAPSPAATASLNIGRLIADKWADRQ